MYYIDTPKELADAIAKKQESFEINGDLIEKVLKIKNTGTTAWIVALGAISCATAAALATTKIGKITIPLTLPLATFNIIGAVPILGIPTATIAVEIAVAFGGVNVLNTLRKYKIIENSEDKLVLHKS
jgi:cellulase/cellobiase CelA1